MRVNKSEWGVDWSRPGERERERVEGESLKLMSAEVGNETLGEGNVDDWKSLFGYLRGIFCVFV